MMTLKNSQAHHRVLKEVMKIGKPEIATQLEWMEIPQETLNLHIGI